MINSKKEYIDETVITIRNLSKVLSENLEDILSQLKGLLNNGDTILTSNQDDIRETIENRRETTQHAKEFTRKIDEQPNALIWGYRTKRGLKERRYDKRE